MFKRTIFYGKETFTKTKFNKKKEVIKQLSEKLEKDIFQNRKRLPQKVLCTKLDFFFAKKNRWKRMFFKVFFSGKEDFSKKFKKFRFFRRELNRGALAHCNVSLSLHQKARSPRVWSDRACGVVRLKNESVCQKRDAPLHPVMKCASAAQ